MSWPLSVESHPPAVPLKRRPIGDRGHSTRAATTALPSRDGPSNIPLGTHRLDRAPDDPCVRHHPARARTNLHRPRTASGEVISATAMAELPGKELTNSANDGRRDLALPGLRRRLVISVVLYVAAVDPWPAEHGGRGKSSAYESSAAMRFFDNCPEERRFVALFKLNHTADCRTRFPTRSSRGATAHPGPPRCIASNAREDLSVASWKAFPPPRLPLQSARAPDEFANHCGTAALGSLISCSFFSANGILRVLFRYSAMSSISICVRAQPPRVIPVSNGRSNTNF